MAAAGEKVTFTVQVAPGLRAVVLVQLPAGAGLVKAKALPLIEIPDNVRVVNPVFLTVAFAVAFVPCVTDPKLKLVQLIEINGSRIFEVKPTDCGLPGALSVMTSEP